MNTELKVPAQSKSRSGRIWAFVLLIALLGAGVWWWHSWSSSKSSTTAHSGLSIVTTVRVATARTGDMPVTYDALGTVTPLADVTVRTQINGQLMSVGFQEGQMVAKGDFLAQIDPRPYQVALEQDLGQMARDQALLQQARADLARYQVLLRQDSIARQQVDDQTFLVRQDEAAVQTDQGQVDSARLNLTYCHIVAPVSGRVGLRQVDPGNYVQTSDTNGLVVLTQLQPITVLFTLPEDDLPAVMAGMQGDSPLPVTAYDRSNTQILAQGTVAALDNEVDTTTGTVKLKASFPNLDNALFPNQFVNAKLTVRVIHDTVLVPSAAIITGSPGTFVYKVGADNTVSVQTVTPGPSDGETTSVIDGLSPGDVVVIDGTDRLKEGARVKIVASADTPPGSPVAPTLPAGGWKKHKRHHHHSDDPSDQAPHE